MDGPVLTASAYPRFMAGLLTPPLTYKKKAQRRFEILDADWEPPVKELYLNAK